MFLYPLPKFLWEFQHKLHDFGSTMKFLLDKADDLEERVYNSNYKLIDDQKVYYFYSYITRNKFDY